MATRQDYYELLGVSKDATDADIKRAYKKLALQNHPDRTQHLSPEERILCEAKFKEASEAAQILLDKNLRYQYDLYGHAGLDGSVQSISKQDALGIFQKYLRENMWKKKEAPSRTHGAYQASAGVVTAPLKAAAAGAVVATTSALYGGATVVAGAVSGIAGLGTGTIEVGNAIHQQAFHSKSYNDNNINTNYTEENPAPTIQHGLKTMTRIVTDPLFGGVSGAFVAGSGVVAGAALAAGGTGYGIYTNVKEGTEEFQQKQNLVNGRNVGDGQIVVYKTPGDAGKSLFRDALR